MTAVTEKFGASAKTFVVPLAGAYLVDISNALIIRFFFWTGVNECHRDDFT
jgi:sodium--glutamate symport carrier gltS